MFIEGGLLYLPEITHIGRMWNILRPDFKLNKIHIQWCDNSSQQWRNNAWKVLQTFVSNEMKIKT